eukprot:1161438-Pelagomonas_calceolata.AAC.3
MLGNMFGLLRAHKEACRKHDQVSEAVWDGLTAGDQQQHEAQQSKQLIITVTRMHAWHLLSHS